MIADDGLPIETACRTLGVSPSGYYRWRFNPPSQRAIRHAWLTDIITEVHATSRQTYGARRVYAELTLGRGIEVGIKQVELLMRRAGIKGLTGRPKYRRAPNMPTATDLVDRQFTRTEPDLGRFVLWVHCTDRGPRAKSCPFGAVDNWASDASGATVGPG